MWSRPVLLLLTAVFMAFVTVVVSLPRAVLNKRLYGISKGTTIKTNLFLLFVSFVVLGVIYWINPEILQKKNTEGTN